jgi:hypothetical protein
MPQGAFIVSQDDVNPRDIRFAPSKDAPDPIPEDQLILRDDIDHALAILRELFKNDDNRFRLYFHPLLSLAPTGLVGNKAQPELAKRALIRLKEEIVISESGNIKNRYMKELGKKAIFLGIPSTFIALSLYLFNTQSIICHFLFLWSGCMVGVWLSFGARKTILKFEDLPILDEDRLEPYIRLIFCGLLTITIGLLFSTKALVVKLGAVSSEQITESVQTSILIGALCGLGEKILPSKIAQQVSKLLG